MILINQWWCGMGVSLARNKLSVQLLDFNLLCQKLVEYFYAKSWSFMRQKKNKPDFIVEDTNSHHSIPYILNQTTFLFERSSCLFSIYHYTKLTAKIVMFPSREVLHFRLWGAISSIMSFRYWVSPISSLTAKNLFIVRRTDGQADSIQNGF